MRRPARPPPRAAAADVGGPEGRRGAPPRRGPPHPTGRGRCRTPAHPGGRTGAGAGEGGRGGGFWVREVLARRGRLPLEVTAPPPAAPPGRGGPDELRPAASCLRPSLEGADGLGAG